MTSAELDFAAVYRDHLDYVWRTLRRFGVFNVRPRKTGIGRNPRTGAEVSIPPGKAVRFKPGKELQTLQ